MKKIICIFLTAAAVVAFAQDKKLCVTVDDLPVVSYGITDPDFQQELTRNLISTFDQYQIPAIGYVNEGKLYREGELDAMSAGLLELWLESGYELGNHTYSHMNYHRSAFADFTADVLKGEVFLRSLVSRYNGNLKYFRHPYLRSGRSKAHADSLSVFLSQNGYTEAPVTIDNDDYLFAKAYHVAFESGDSSLMAKIGQDYVEYMEQKLLYFEKLSEGVYGRTIAQTLLTHANLLNAHYLDDLAEMYVRNGYRFVSQTEVLEDVAYRDEITRYGDWGISWLERWALSKGKATEVLKEDPQTPEYIVKMAQ